MRDIIKTLFSPRAMKKFRDAVLPGAETQLSPTTPTPALPPIPRELVEALGWAFPERCPDPSDDERTIWIKAGRRDVVRLVMEWEAQQRGEISSHPPLRINRRVFSKPLRARAPGTDHPTASRPDGRSDSGG